MPPWKTREPLRQLESLRPHTTSGSESFRTFENRVYLRVRVAVVDIHVIREDGDAGDVEFLLHAPVVLDGTAEAPVPQLLPRFRCAQASIGEPWLDPRRVQFNHAEPVLHEPLDECAAVLRRHRQVVIAERLQPELHTADERSIAAGLSLRGDITRAEGGQ